MASKDYFLPLNHLKSLLAKNMNSRRLWYSIFGFFIVFVLLSISIAKTSAIEKNSLEDAISDLFTQKVISSRVSIDNLRNFISNLTSFPNSETPSRKFGTNGSLMAAIYLKNLLSNFGILSSFENFTVDGTVGHNVVGELIGTDINKKEELILITAHYDSISNGDIAPGAIDNGSGVAVILEIARLLTQVERRRTIRFIFFDGEELGLYGSRAYVAQHKAELNEIKAVINLDCVTSDRLFVWYGEHDHKFFLNEINMIAEEFYDFPIASRAPAWTKRLYFSDHAPFWVNKVPVCCVMQPNFPNVHTANDVPVNIDFANVKTITQIFLEVTFFYCQREKFPDSQLFLPPEILIFVSLLMGLILSRFFIGYKGRQKQKSGFDGILS